MESSRIIAIVYSLDTENGKIGIKDYSTGRFFSYLSSHASKYSLWQPVELFYKNKSVQKINRIKDYQTTDGVVQETSEAGFNVQVASSIITVPRQFCEMPVNYSPQLGDPVIIYSTKEISLFFASFTETEKNSVKKTYKLSTNISAHRYKIEKLQKLRENNDVNQEVLKYGAWRKVRPDGNSLYRAIGVKLIENYCRVSTPIQFLDELLKQLTEELGVFTPYYDTAGRRTLIESLEHLRNLKRLKPEYLMREVQDLLKSQEFDGVLIAFIREVAYRYLELHFEEYQKCGASLEQINEQIRIFLEYSGECPDESYLLSCISRGLEVRIDTIPLDPSSANTVSFSGETVHTNIALVVHRNTYNILYTHEEMQTDEYDLSLKDFAKPKDPYGSFNVRYISQLFTHLKFLYETIDFLFQNTTVNQSSFPSSFYSSIGAY